MASLGTRLLVFIAVLVLAACKPAFDNIKKDAPSTGDGKKPTHVEETPRDKVTEAETSDASAEDKRAQTNHRNLISKKDPNYYKSTLTEFAGDVNVENWGKDPNAEQDDVRDTFRVLSRIIVDSTYHLTEVQIETLTCVLLCGLGTCVPSCPGYSNPPWGLSVPDLNRTQELPLFDVPSL